MIKKTILSASIISVFLFSTFTTAQAEVAKTDKSAKVDVITSLKVILKAKLRAEPSSLKESIIPNLYEAMYGTEVVYVSADGKYFISGDLIDINTRENLSDVAKQSVRKGIMDKQDNKPITFKAKNEKYKLAVFTDIDCPYCAKLHREVPQLNKAGITIEYLMFPRAGIGSASFKKAVSVWCADDKLQAMTTAKERKQLADKSCENPITSHYNLGGEVGVTGTPALILESGKLIPGYVPADRLVKMLEKEAKTSNN